MDLLTEHPTTRSPEEEEVFRSQGYRLIEREPILALLMERHGFPPELFKSLLFFQISEKIVRATSAEVELFDEPVIDRVGIDFLRIDMAVPRLTSTAAMTFGSAALLNVVDLNADLCEAYLNRERLHLSPDLMKHCTSRGFIILRFDGHGLGLGFLESTSQKDSNCGEVRSLFPSAFAADLRNHSPFGNPS